MQRRRTDTTYKKGDYSNTYLNKIRKLEREKVKKLYPDAHDFEQKVVTHGIPNNQGEVRPGTVVLVTMFSTESGEDL